MRAWAWLAVALAACAGAPAAAPPGSSAPRAPVTVAIDVEEGEPVAGARMAFRARVQMHGAWSAPIAVEFHVPRGALIAAGAPQAVVGAGGDGPRLELELLEVPAEDLVLVARSTAEGAGFHAEARYRFGRPAPVKRGPDRPGPSLRSPTGADLGPPVPMGRDD
jgi:hypothetical protein